MKRKTKNRKRIIEVPMVICLTTVLFVASMATAFTAGRWVGFSEKTCVNCKQPEQTETTPIPFDEDMTIYCHDNNNITVHPFFDENYYLKYNLTDEETGETIII